MPRSLTPLAIVLAFAVTAGVPATTRAASTTVIQNSNAIRDAGVIPASLEPKGVGSGTTWYVAPSGNDWSNDGKSEARPFRTLQRAANVVNPGDVVSLLNGTHANPNPWGIVMELRRSGTPNRWITIRPQPGHNPVVYVRNWSGIHIRDAGYILIEGLTVRGNLFEVSYAEAWNQRFNLGNPLTAGNGIVVKPGDRDSQIPHHIVIRDNTVYEVPGAGIMTGHSDYVLIERNTVHHTSWWSPYGQSGISVWESKNFDWNTGYKIFLLDNTVHEVDNKVPFVFVGRITDGHAMIVDQNQNTARFPSRSPYVGRTLVAGNITYAIGGRGFNAFQSKNVDLLGNRLLSTTQNPAHQPKATVTVLQSANVLIRDNMMDNPKPHIWQSANVTSDVSAPGVTALAK